MCVNLLNLGEVRFLTFYQELILLDLVFYVIYLKILISSCLLQPRAYLYLNIDLKISYHNHLDFAHEYFVRLFHLQFKLFLNNFSLF